jgi:5'-nucleotidase
VASRGQIDYDVAAAFSVRLSEKIFRDPLPPGLVLNVNVPWPWRNGVRLTRQSQKISKNILVENIDPRGRNYYWIHEQVDLSRIEAGTDYAAIRSGSISITPLHTDRTDAAALADLARWFEELNRFAITPE